MSKARNLYDSRVIDWMSFLSGLAGTLVGAGLAFGLFSLWRHRRHLRKRHEAVQLIEAELQALIQSLLADEVAREEEMTPGTRLQLARAVNCISSLRGFDRGNAKFVASWASQALGALLTSPNPAERPKLANQIVEALTAWDGRGRSWKWFRDDPAQFDWYDETPDVLSDDLERRLRGL